MKKFTIALAATATLALAACGEPAEDAMVDEAMTDQTVIDTAEPGTIVAVAQDNADFSMLVSAITSADLAGTLSGAGPYTVFAPTNSAFEEIPQATRDELMSEAGQQDLSNILTYHVVEGETSAQDLMTAIEGAGADGYELTTVNGATLTAMMQDGNVVLTDAAGNIATVTTADIDASNGVIHVIDTVLMPS